MINTFDKDALFPFIKDLYTMVGIRISIFDDEFKLVTEYPVNAPRLCSMIRGTEDGLAACKECDYAACERAKKLNQAHVYQCHAGLTEAITPVQLGDGIVGYAIFAHMLPEDDQGTAIDEVCRRSAKFGLTELELTEAASEIKPCGTEKIMASIRMLNSIAAYLQIKRLAVWKNDDLAAQINMFIEDNLGQELDSDIICRRFSLSRTKLYQVSIGAYGMGITKYVMSRRIEKAKELLDLGGRAVAAIAQDVGIEDYNYFCKVFKKAVGVSPAKFKRRI